MGSSALRPTNPATCKAKEFKIVQRRGPCRTVSPGFGSEIARTGIGADWDRLGQICGRNISTDDAMPRISSGSNWLFTPLRVGWPPTPQVYFGP